MTQRPTVPLLWQLCTYRISSRIPRLNHHVQIKSPQARLRLQSTTSSHHLSLPDPPPPIKKGIFRFTGAFLLYTVLGLAMAAAPQLANGNYDFVPPTDAETLTLFNPEPESREAEIEHYMQTHPFVQSLYADEDLIPARPHLKIPPALRPLNLTGGTLLGNDKIGVPPLAFTTRDGSRYVSIQYLGPALCGYPGIVHGGMLATLLDEGLARCCFPALPSKVGVTASLKIDYKAPTKAEQFVVLRAETTKLDGRKAWVKGWLETLPSPSEYQALLLDQSSNGVAGHEPNGAMDGQVKPQTEDGRPVRLVEAEALFVEPKNAGTMMRLYSDHNDASKKPPPTEAQA